MLYGHGLNEETTRHMRWDELSFDQKQKYLSEANKMLTESNDSETSLDETARKLYEQDPIEYLAG